jgi:hypothetical protein
MLNAYIHVLFWFLVVHFSRLKKLSHTSAGNTVRSAPHSRPAETFKSFVKVLFQSEEQYSRANARANSNFEGAGPNFYHRFRFVSFSFCYFHCMLKQILVSKIVTRGVGWCSLKFTMISPAHLPQPPCRTRHRPEKNLGRLCLVVESFADRKVHVFGLAGSRRHV